ncbi:MAG: restriction endonuclease [Saprospiraceae bacterium]|nr:restriction endonuclease [Bacteroidia bacterium]MBP7541220.1 restriction endonuclease [Saprospiraceae bacterium]MBP9179934.1 restriction endonuclease [Bacteroidia bacterium]MBP9724830.1 restriction endonuclease [Bacteroidia bacterium]
MDKLSLLDFYVNRDNEIEKISFGLSNYNNVLIIGNAGIGKTTLAKIYTELNPLNFKHINYLRGISLEFEKSQLNSLEKPLNPGETTLTIIDGIDEILNNDERNRILHVVKEGRKYGHKTILTTRPYAASVLDILSANSYSINLNNFSQDEAFRLIRNRLAHGDFNDESLEVFKPILDALDYNPLLTFLTTELVNSNKLTPREILSLVTQKLIYKNLLLVDESNSKILIPEAPKIITDVRVINSKLIHKVNENPKLIHSLSSRQFEEFVAELFEKDGYNVSLTQQTHDGGKDLFIVENKRMGKFIYYVECKKYAAENPVGVRLVRELYGTVTADRATAGVLVTSSYFSDEAKQFTEQIKTQMSLLEYADLTSWVNEIAGKNNSR